MWRRRHTGRRLQDDGGEIRGMVEGQGRPRMAAPPAPGRGTRTLPQSLRGSPALPTPWSQTCHSRAVKSKFLLFWAINVWCCHGGPRTLARDICPRRCPGPTSSQRFQPGSPRRAPGHELAPPWQPWPHAATAGGIPRQSPALGSAHTTLMASPSHLPTSTCFLFNPHHHGVSARCANSLAGGPADHSPEVTAQPCSLGDWRSPLSPYVSFLS